MNKNDGLLSSADSIIENKLMALADSWPGEAIARLRSKISLHTTSLSMRRSMLLHENADDATRKTQTEFFQSLRIADKSNFDRDAASFPVAYRRTVVDLLAMYTGLRASEILRESRNQRQSLRLRDENEALIRHWARTGLVPTETIIDGVSTTVPNTLWNAETQKAATTETERNNNNWSAEETFAQRLTIFSKTAELNGTALRQYLSSTLAPAHRAAEAEINRRYNEATAKNINNDTFRAQNKSLIQHANALENRVAYVFNKLAPQPRNIIDPRREETAIPVTSVNHPVAKKSFSDTVKEKVEAAYDLANTGVKLISAGIRWLARPVVAGAATVSLAAVAAVTPALLGEAEVSGVRSAHICNTPSSPHTPGRSGILACFLKSATKNTQSPPSSNTEEPINSVGLPDVRLEIR